MQAPAPFPELLLIFGLLETKNSICYIFNSIYIFYIYNIFFLFTGTCLSACECVCRAAVTRTRTLPTSCTPSVPSCPAPASKDSPMSTSTAKSKKPIVIFVTKINNNKSLLFLVFPLTVRTFQGVLVLCLLLAFIFLGSRLFHLFFLNVNLSPFYEEMAKKK